MGRPPRTLPGNESAPRHAPQTDEALGALRRVLAPLVRFLLAAGADYTRLAAELKPVFIEQAKRELLASGRADTDSAISLLSGVHRKDVRRWRESGLGEKIVKQVSLSSQVYARWLQDSCYLDRRRRPKTLARLGPAPSFESLAQDVTRDVRPFTVLAELLRLGLVRIELRKEREFVVPTREGFVPALGSQELLDLFSSNLAGHAKTAVANLLGSPARLEQSVFAEGLTTASAEDLAELARKLWSRARAEMIAEARRFYERDRGKPDATRRMRFGTYFWDESIVAEREGSKGDHKP